MSDVRPLFGALVAAIWSSSSANSDLVLNHDLFTSRQWTNRCTIQNRITWPLVINPEDNIGLRGARVVCGLFK